MTTKAALHRLVYGGIAYRGHGCHFCGAAALRGVVRLRCDDAACLDTVPGQYALCLRHLAVFEAAGAAGRVHGATGWRWTLVQPVPAAER
jgi:hypothetical protein